MGSNVPVTAQITALALYSVARRGCGLKPTRRFCGAAASLSNLRKRGMKSCRACLKSIINVPLYMYHWIWSIKFCKYCVGKPIEEDPCTYTPCWKVSHLWKSKQAVEADIQAIDDKSAIIRMLDKSALDTWRDNCHVRRKSGARKRRIGRANLNRN